MVVDLKNIERISHKNFFKEFETKMKMNDNDVYHYHVRVVNELIAKRKIKILTDLFSPPHKPLLDFLLKNRKGYSFDLFSIYYKCMLLSPQLPMVLKELFKRNCFNIRDINNYSYFHSPYFNIKNHLNELLEIADGDEIVIKNIKKLALHEALNNI